MRGRGTDRFMEVYRLTGPRPDPAEPGSGRSDSATYAVVNRFDRATAISVAIRSTSAAATSLPWLVMR